MITGTITTIEKTRVCFSKTQHVLYLNISPDFFSMLSQIVTVTTQHILISTQGQLLIIPQGRGRSADVASTEVVSWHCLFGLLEITNRMKCAVGGNVK